MKIVPFITKSIIAPHGITDLSHSILTNNLNNLIKIYGINFSITNLIINRFQNPYLINSILLFSSVLHFNHDFNNYIYFNNKYNSFILLSIILFLSVKNNLLLFFYMIIFHIPNHYKINMFHIKKLKKLNIILYLFITLIIFYLDINHKYLYFNKFFINNIKSIIISHILYQELYIL